MQVLRYWRPYDVPVLGIAVDKDQFRIMQCLRVMLPFRFSRMNGSSPISPAPSMRKPSLIAFKSNSVGGSVYYQINNNNRQMGSSGQTLTVGSSGQMSSAAVLAAARQRKLQARSADNLLLWRPSLFCVLRTKLNSEWECFFVIL